MKKKKSTSVYDMIGIAMLLFFMTDFCSVYDPFYIKELDFYMNMTSKTVLLYTAALLYFLLPIRKYYRKSVFAIIYYMFPVYVMVHCLFAQYHLVWFIILTVLFFVILCVFCVVMDIIRVESRSRKQERKLRTVCARIGLLSVLLPLSVSNIYMGNKDFKSPTYVGKTEVLEASLIDENYGLKQVMEQHSKDLCNLTEDKWKELTEQEQMNVLAAIVEIESVYLGVERKKVSCENLASLTAGQYCDEDGTIAVNRKYLNDCGQMLETILHEMFHVYQHKMISILKTADAEYQPGMYYGDLMNWKNSHDNYTGNYEEGYYVQALEVAARRYSAQQKGVYLQFLGQLEECGQ